MSPHDSNSATRLIHFRDTRPPHAIQFELEHDHMVLLSAATEDGRLTYRARSKVNGAPFELTLRFESALMTMHCYSLSITISWADLAPQAREYHRKAATGWLDVWFRHYTPSSPATPGEHASSRYDALVEATGSTINAVHRIGLEIEIVE